MQISDSSSINIFVLWKSLKRHWRPVVAVFLTTIATATIATILQKPIYSAEGKLSFRRSSATATLTGLGKEASDLTSLREQTSPIDTEVEIIRSYPIAKDTITFTKLKDSNGKTTTLKDFTKRLKITPIKGTDIIQINYEDLDPKTSADVVNTVMDIYLEKATENYRENAAKAIEFIEKQIPIAEQKVKKAELELRYFQERNSIASIEEERKNSVQFLFGLKNEIKTAQSQLADTEGQLQIIQSQLGIDTNLAVKNVAISQSKGVENLVIEKQRVEAQLAVESTRYQESHPVIQGLQSQLSALTNLLQERVDLVNNQDIEGQVANSSSVSLKQALTAQLVQLESRKLGLINQNRTLVNLEEQYKQRIDSLPKLEQRQRELSRYLDTAQTTYTLLLGKVEELRVAQNQNASNATIVAAAIIPQEPVGSSKVLFIVASALLGSLLAIATAILLESRDKSIRTVEDVIQVFDFPLLGEIPLIEEKYKVVAITGRDTPVLSGVVLDKEQNFHIHDASQLLGASLKVLNINQSIKTIVITSVEPQEGKSTIAAYLAASLSQLGAKVALVDANLHSPSQHQLWHLDNNLGLSNVLLKSSELDLAMVESIPNLSLLPSGMSSTSHPITLLDSLNMKKVIHNLSSTYDYIILDTPAIRSNSDALFLSSFSDGIMLVVRPGVSTLDSAAYLEEALTQSGQTVFGLVINGVKGKPKIKLEDSIEITKN